MNLLSRYAITFGFCLASASTAIAQQPVGDTLCGLYNQASGGKDAFVAFRGKELDTNRWELKDVVIEGGTCSVRSNAKKKFEALTCSFERASADEAKKWVDEMAAATRTCVANLTGFVEKQGAGDDTDEKDRIGWSRDLETGTLRIGLAAVEKDGKSLNRVAIRFNEKS